VNGGRAGRGLLRNVWPAGGCGTVVGKGRATGYWLGVCNGPGPPKHRWWPEQTGRNYTMVPDNPMAAFEPYRDYMTIVSNTDVKMAEAFAAPEIGGDHFRSSAVFLTQSHPTQTEGSDIYVGTSLDQMYAQRFGQATPIPSMQLCIEPLDRAGGCAYGYSCMYTDSISWASPTEPLPMIRAGAYGPGGAYAASTAARAAVRFTINANSGAAWPARSSPSRPHTSTSS